MKRFLLAILLILFVFGVSFAQTAVPEGFVRIQGGSFVREGQTITVSAFYMGKYEVTQREYEEIMGRNPSEFKGGNLPVENVSWFDAVEYCNRRSHREGLTLAYRIDGNNVTWNREATGYRLPTEAEWEYACRAGTRTPYNTGNTITTDQANFNGQYEEEVVNEIGMVTRVTRGQYREKTTPVGSFAANAWGLHDMHGNVWEWCWDWYGDYPAGAQTNPTGAPSGSYRVIRGGSWSLSVEYLQSALRIRDCPSYRYGNIGFRVLRP